jgi:hypothetical protein
VLLPVLSAYDPPASGEGSRDPLGLEAVAERLASAYLPDVTSRMHRIRALTVIAVGAHVCDPFADEYTADGSAPAWLVFEWVWAEATARSRAEASSIPGIATTKSRVSAGERLSTRNYLKGAISMGLHGSYRTLAEAAQVIGPEGRLDDLGERLVHAWAHDQKLTDFIGDYASRSRELQFLRDAVRRSLVVSACDAPRTGNAVWRLQRHLTPAFAGRCRHERTRLAEILRADDCRAATLELLAEPSVSARRDDLIAQITEAAARAGSRSEEPFPQIASALRALIAFERFSTIVVTAFDLLRYQSTVRLRRPLPLTELIDPRHTELAERIQPLIRACDKRFDAVDADEQRQRALDAFRGVTDDRTLVEAVMGRHLETQRAKGSGGKLPWFECGDRVVVRGAYTLLDSPGSPGDLLHQTRLPNAAAFLRELG